MYKKLRQIILSFCFLLLFLASSWALLRADFFRFHDFTQGARIVEMSHAVQDNHFPVIWSENLGYGYGMPLFEFYGPLPYYVGAVVYLLGFSLIDSIKILFFISTLVTIFGSYYLGKKLFGTTAGLLTSAAVTLAPYRAVNLYVRGALSESWGIMMLPLILLGIIKVIKREKFGWVIVVVSIFILLISHNLTALIFLPLSVIFAIGFFFIHNTTYADIRKNILATLSQLVGSYTLGFLLSSFYIVPAFLEKGFTRLESTVLGDYFDYKLHFVGLRQFITENWGYGGSTYGPEDGISFYLGFGQILGIFFCIYLLFLGVRTAYLKQKKLVIAENSLIYILILALTALALLLATAKTQFIWEQISLLSFLQFPWRYLSAGIVFLGLAVGGMVYLLPNKSYRFLYTGIFICILLFNAQYFRPEEFSSNLSEYYYADTNQIRTQMSKTLPDYIPVQIQTTEISPVALEGQVLYCQVLQNCEFSSELITNKVQEKTVKITTQVAENVVFSIGNFPGWSATVDNSVVPVTTSAEGYVQVLVPPGDHVVKVYLQQTTVRKTAALTSVFSLVIFLSVYFWYYKKEC